MSSENQQKASENQQKRIPLAKKINYAILVSGWDVMGKVGISLEKYYTDFLMMPPTLFGAAHLAYAFVNSFNDPIMGYLIDRMPARSRNQIKYLRMIMWALPMMALGVTFQLLGQPHWNELLLFLCVFLGYSIFDTGTATFWISLNCIALETSTSDDDRGDFVGVNLIFQTIFGVVGFILPTIYLTSGATQAQALTMFLGFGVCGMIMYLLGALYLRKQSLMINPAQSRKLWSVLKRIIRQKSYLFYLVISFLANGISANVELFLLYYADDYMELPSELITLVTIVVVPIGFILYIFAGNIIRKLGVKKVVCLALGCFIVGYGGALMGLKSIPGMVFLSLTFIGASLWWVIAFPLLGNVVDEYNIKNGERNEGVLMGINSIFQSPGPSLVIFIFSAIITAFGYQGGGGSLSEFAKLGLRIGIGGVCLLFATIALVFTILMPKCQPNK